VEVEVEVEDILNRRRWEETIGQGTWTIPTFRALQSIRDQVLIKEAVVAARWRDNGSFHYFPIHLLLQSVAI
jgi:hypothetical protein